MRSPGRGLPRALRAAAAGTAATSLALLGHLAGEGTAPPLELLVTVSGLLAGAFGVLGRRQRRFSEILVALLSAQVAFHVAFTLAHPAAAPQSAGDALQPPAVSFFPEPAMAAAHLLAGVATAALLAYGEAAVWAVFRILAGVVVTAVTAPLGAVAPLWSVRPAPARVPWLAQVLVLRSAPRRGPPAAAAF